MASSALSTAHTRTHVATKHLCTLIHDAEDEHSRLICVYGKVGMSVQKMGGCQTNGRLSNISKRLGGSGPYARKHCKTTEFGNSYALGTASIRIRKGDSSFNTDLMLHSALHHKRRGEHEPKTGSTLRTVVSASFLASACELMVAR